MRGSVEDSVRGANGDILWSAQEGRTFNFASFGQRTKPSYNSCVSWRGGFRVLSALVAACRMNLEKVTCFRSHSLSTISRRVSLILTDLTIVFRHLVSYDNEFGLQLGCSVCHLFIERRMPHVHAAVAVWCKTRHTHGAIARAGCSSPSWTTGSFRGVHR
jgi:hypothetical protein